MSVGMFDGLRPLADTLSGPGGAAGGWYGVYVAVVTANEDDPQRQGRVKVELPWSPDGGTERYETWARVATLMAGKGRGTWFVPDPHDEVLVAFEGGDPRKPVVLGSLWNGKDAPPEQMAAQNPKRTILTGAGVRITLDDTVGAVSLLLETPGGQRVRLDDTPATVTIEDGNSNSVTLDAAGVTVVAAAQVNITAKAVMNVSATTLNVTAPISTFKVIQCDSVITSSTVSAAYMPGAGNLL
jgi:uncharacterized protein involved in type VI secretion and phage assembly